MKKIMFAGLLIVTLGTASLGCVSKHIHQNNESSLILANIEALAEDDDLVGDKIPCWSSAVRDYKQAYVDCAGCTRI